MRSSSRYAVVLAAAVSPLLLAGCGGGSDLADEEPTTIVDETVRAMEEVETLHLSGALSQGGSDYTIDLDASADGDCQGAIGMTAGNLEILSVDQQTYVKGDAGFWEQQAGEQAAAIQAIVGDKWVLLPGGGTFESFCNVNQLVGNIEGSEYEKLGDAEVDGEDAVRLTSTGESSTTIYVATDEPHRLLKIESQTGALTFSGFDEDVTVEAPPEDEVVDLTGASGGTAPSEAPETEAPAE